MRWPACQVTGIDFSATSVRSTDTISVQERLPPGAAGVLINRTHAYRDLIMPIDSTEKRLVDALTEWRRLLTSQQRREDLCLISL